MLFARTPEAEQKLIRMFAKHQIQRAYVAVVHGRVEAQTIDTWLVRDRGDGLRGSLSSLSLWERAGVRAYRRTPSTRSRMFGRWSICRITRSSNAAWKRAARIKSAFTCPKSAIPSAAKSFTRTSRASRRARHQRRSAAGASRRRTSIHSSHHAAANAFSNAAAEEFESVALETPRRHITHAKQFHTDPPFPPAT